MKDTSKERYEWLDILKGIGIMLIMVSHCSALRTHTTIDNYLYACYIPLFFIASGFTFRRRASMKTLIVEKSKRLLLPYLVYGVLFTFIHFLNHYRLGNVDPMYYTRWIGLLYGRLTLYYQPQSGDNIMFLVDGPLWFLPALFLTYLLANYYLGLTRHQRIAYIIFSLVFSILCTKLPIYLPWCIDEIFLASLFFIMGYYFKSHCFRVEENHTTARICKHFCPPLLLYIALVLFNGKVGMHARVYGNLGIASPILFLFIGSSGTYLWYTVSKALQGKLVGRFFAIVGKNSLRLMCIHIPLGEIFHSLGARCNPILLGIVSIGLYIAISVMMEKVIERYKSRLPLLRFL